MNVDSIWARRGESTLSKATYIRLTSLFTVLEGFLVYIGAFVSRSWPSSGWLALLMFLVSLVGVFMIKTNGNVYRSALGVTIMSLSLGLMCGPFFALNSSAVLVESILLTVSVMVVMSLVGITFPAVFEGWGIWLLLALVLLLVVQIAQSVLMSLGYMSSDMTLLAWLGILIFTAVVAHDWSRALRIPYTVNNAIDASGGLILSAINLALRFVILLRGGSVSRSG
ncbi:Bax inhibitor-1 family protein [Patescibacteria group bacterium]|nr:Bax inhibitor-1 family protein [Patescibacteria group bacterium]